MLDLRQLRYFSCVAELKSFSAAADQLRIAQPALSRCVKQIEDELGVELLARHGRGVTPTAAGEKLYHHAQRLMREMRIVREEVVASSGTPFGHLYLAMPPATGQILAPPVIERYRALYPRVSLHILEGFSGYIHEWLNTGRIDVAVLHNPMQGRNLAIRPLLSEEMFVIAPGPNCLNPLPAADSYSVSELADLPLILPSKPHSLRMLIEVAVAKTDRALEPAIEVDGLPIIKAMVERGLGFTTLTQPAVTREVANGMLRAIPIRSPGIRWDLDIACRRDRQPSEAARELIRIIEEEVQELVRTGVWIGSKRLDGKQ
ncbi:MAG TPA: LysR family transcriptional regulator [Rhizobiaceae bacterium]|nr:LysR family transcriptional regulator [Rhizobiaceae bacterium]